jgi:phosphatidate cytidylyltransferase
VLGQRVVTAVVLLLVLVGALAWSLSAFKAVATMIVGIALGEWLKLVGWSYRVALVVAASFTALLLAAALSTPIGPHIVLPLAVVATVVWAAIGLWLMQPAAMAIRLPRSAATLLALLLAGAAWAALMHFVDQGIAMVLSVLVIVWIADTAAYFAGRAFGRRKLAPHISPGKTWAGVVGALIAVVAVALLVARVWPAGDLFSNRLIAASGAGAALLLAAVVALSVVGDLFESLLKRQAGVKDSSQLLPGHGGVYDRIDALVPVLPLAALLEWMTL